MEDVLFHGVLEHVVLTTFACPRHFDYQEIFMCRI